MCGHGLIGVVRTLEHLGRIAPGHGARRHAGRARWRRAGARRRGHDRERAGVRAPGRRGRARAGRRGRARGRRVGRQLVLPHRVRRPLALALPNVRELTRVTWRSATRSIRDGVTGAGGADRRPRRIVRPADRRRTPTAGTSCSAPAWPTTARRAAPGRRRRWPCCMRAASCAPGERWRQESITGSRVHRLAGGAWRHARLVPRIQGRAFVTGARHAALRSARPVSVRHRGRVTAPTGAGAPHDAAGRRVVGAGIVGAACAEALARSRWTCTSSTRRSPAAGPPPPRWATSW